MIKPPLFGKDSSPQYTAPRLSAIVTSALTLLFFIVVILVPAPKPEKKPEPIRIVLDTTPLIELEKEFGETSSATDEIASEAAAPVEEEIVEQTSPAFEPVNPEPVIKEPEVPVKDVEPVKAPEPKVEPKYTKRTDNDWNTRKSVDDLLDFSANKTTDKTDFDWDSMDFSEGNTSKSNQTVQKKIDSSNALSGSAGTSSSKTSERQSSSQSAESRTEDKSDSSTSNALKGISKTDYKEKTYSGSNNSVKMKTADTASGTSVSMNDGTNRILLKPMEPKISIPSDLAKDINGEPTVTITFTVLEDGTVPESYIDINPRSLLTKDVLSEITFQLSTWKFQPGNSKATASFAFTIKKQ